MNQAFKRTMLAAVLASAAIGCETPAKPKPAPPQPTWTMPLSREAATAELVPLVAKFNDDISAFPGTTGAEHRQTLVVALDDLGRILRLINGPVQSPGFTNSLAIIAESKQTATIQSIPRERMEAVENQALQATASALNELVTRYLLDKDQLPGLLETLNTKVATAATVQGPMHDLDATDSFRAVAAVVQQMTDDLKAMVSESPSSGTPAPEVPVTPVAPPTTAPATMPVP